MPSSGSGCGRGFADHGVEAGFQLLLLLAIYTKITLLVAAYQSRSYSLSIYDVREAGL
jgi:hypothetical protein